MQKTITLQKQQNAQKKIEEFVAGQQIKSEMQKLTVFLGMFSLAVSGRVALQMFPSVEPIIPLAVIAGMIFGIKEGFTLGASAFVVSNFFVWGLQGPWTVFQAIGAGIGGVIGGILGKTNTIGWKSALIATVIGTVFFELIMNISGAFMGIGFFGFGLMAIPLYFLTSLPFSLVHIVSNAFFARLFSPLLKLRGDKNEIEIMAYRAVSGSDITDFRLYRSASADRNGRE